MASFSILRKFLTYILLLTGIKMGRIPTVEKQQLLNISVNRSNNEIECKYLL
jgi:hypothetical protein